LLRRPLITTMSQDSPTSAATQDVGSLADLLDRLASL